ncbi:hypothetical protein EVG20_g10975 [Dentipellis fragilis]|uniref:Uncharacterized protein n=1 Tax=Dentipellis fragilis TaxID=205917 RepID=A0A4Y9XMH4_9AGAM|nr:hypothetical protein EVG20_g10975 [Dentipellis fragilis]
MLARGDDDAPTPQVSEKVVHELKSGLSTSQSIPYLAHGFGVLIDCDRRRQRRKIQQLTAETHNQSIQAHICVSLSARMPSVESVYLTTSCPDVRACDRAFPAPSPLAFAFLDLCLGLGVRH